MNDNDLGRAILKTEHGDYEIFIKNIEFSMTDTYKPTIYGAPISFSPYPPNNLVTVQMEFDINSFNLMNNTNPNNVNNNNYNTKKSFTEDEVQNYFIGY